MAQQWLFDQLPIGAAVVARDYQIQRVNDRLCELTGYAADELRSLRLTHILHSDEPIDALLDPRPLEAGHASQGRRDLQYSRRDGQLRWAHIAVRPVSAEEHGGPCLLVTVEDITDRKAAEAPLVRAKQECERTFHSMPDPIAILDTKHRIVRANQALAERLGRTPEELVGRFCYEVVHETDQPPPFCPHSLLLADGVGHCVETHQQCLDGDYLVSVTPLHDTDGTVIGSVHVARDITGRRRAERKLREAYDTLEKRVQQRTAELANVNRALRTEILERERLEREVLQCSTQEQRRMGEELHDELGQELTGLGYLARSLSHRLRPDMPEEAELATELTAGIRRALGRTRAIVRGLLPVEIDADNLIPAVQAMAADIEERFGIRCRASSSGPLSVHDDHTAIQLFRIAQGAANNAVRHGEAKNIVIELKAGDGRVTLQVHDDGIGIQPDADKGTGSGLRIMRYRSRAIGGRFDVQRQAMGGTAVTCVVGQERGNGSER